MKLHPLLPGIALFLLPTINYGWWDTRMEVITHTLPPLQEFPAAENQGSNVLDDPQANGGRGGKVLRITPEGKPLERTVTLKPGLYSWTAICRLPIESDKTATPLFTVTLSEKGNQLNQWTLPGRLGKFYSAVIFYIPIYHEGTYTLTFNLEPDIEKLNITSPRPDGGTFVRASQKSIEPIAKSVQETKEVLLDRLELANALAPEPLKQRKQKRNLPPEQALALIGEPEKPKRGEFLHDLSNVWEAIDFNKVADRDRDGVTGYRLARFKRAVHKYHKTQSEDAALFAAYFLCALAEKWPAVQYTATFFGENGMFILNNRALYHTETANAVGKMVYRGWSSKPTETLVAAYDYLFDFIKSNPRIVELVGAKIPTIKTNDDLIAFLDERILWCSARDVKRGWIGGDDVAPLIARVLGPGPLADTILSETVYDRIQTNMTHLGAIDDQAVTSFNRDGFHHVASTRYANSNLNDLANNLAEYHKLGGDAKFDLLSNPEGRPAQLNPYTLEAIKVAGGMMVQIGDAGSYDRGREQNYTPHPSRVLGGAGITILESGQFGNNPLEGRAVAITWGGGRGHAHSDTLNIELFAQGSRMSPDLGGRDEGKREAHPNMRSNRSHNLVEIDGKDFWNRGPSITPASGWLTSFAPAAQGVQFTEHGASARSHPNVSLYQRQTALVNVPGTTREESYIFDVFRVKGGRTHSYNFHGGDTEAIKANVELTPAEDHPYLKSHKAETRFKGIAGEILQIDWPMREKTQKGYQKNYFEPDRQAVTRLLLFGQKDQTVLVGNAYSKYYKYDYPFFYLYKKGRKDLTSVFPAVIEMFAGEPFIASAKPLLIPQNDALGATAVEVETTTGRRDFLYSSGNIEEHNKVGDTHSVAGRFAFVATSKEGQLQEAKLVGGLHLETPEITIRVPRARLEWKVAKVDYPQRTVELETPISPVFANTTIHINNGHRLHAFNIEAVDGKKVVLKEYPAFYKSNLLVMGDKPNSIVGEIPPDQADWDPDYAKNTVLTNEDHSRTYRVSRWVGERRWMSMTFPGFRWSFPTKPLLEDFPDLDGDGRRIATLEKAFDAKEGAEGQKMEILNVADNRIYYRPVDRDTDINVKRGGWAINGFRIVPEGGKVQYFSRYSGRTVGWVLQSEPNLADFTDANGDGKIKIYGFVFGEGDMVEADAHVQVLRDSNGNYQVVANTPAEVVLTFPGAKQVEIAYGNGKQSKVKANAKGATTLKITPEMVAEGNIKITAL